MTPTPALARSGHELWLSSSFRQPSGNLALRRVSLLMIP